MKSEEKQSTTYSFDNNNKGNANIITQNNFYKDKTISPKNKPLYLNILNSQIFKKPKFQKTKTTFNIKSNKRRKNKLFPLLTFNSFSSIDSPNNSKQELENLKNKIISNKSNINKKKMELQELKIQYNKLFDENKNNTNLIFNVLQLENEHNNNNNNNSSVEIDPYTTYTTGGPGTVNISEEQLLTRINNCKIDEVQEKKLKASYALINLRETINSKKKLLLSKTKEYDKLKDIFKFKNKNEIIDKLENLVLEAEKIKTEIPKLEEILEKNNNEKIPKLEEELENAEKNNESIIKKEKEYKKDFNDKINKLKELEQEIQYLESKVNSKKISVNKISNSPEYKGAKIVGLKLKSNIDKMKFELRQIDKYKNEEREGVLTLAAERKSIIDEQKKKNDELESKISELEDKKRYLYSKTLEYDEEKKKLENRGKESFKDIRRMKELEEQLNKVKNKKQGLVQECEEKEKQIENTNKEHSENIKNENEKINDLKNNIKDMNEQINELKDKINKMQNDIDKYQQAIDNKKSEIDNIKQENNNDNKEEDKEKDKEKDKGNNNNTNEDKRQMLINENKKYRKENEKLQNQINLFNEQIKKYQEFLKKSK